MSPPISCFIASSSSMSTASQTAPSGVDASPATPGRRTYGSGSQVPSAMIPRSATWDWAAEGSLVLYYGDVGYWTGITPIGEVDGDIQAVAEQSGDFSATVELAQ